jgi:hypothetical protein
MRAFAANGYRLRHARLEVRVVYSGFLLLTLVGMATMAAFQMYHIGLSPARIATFYRGGELDGQMVFAKTLRELVEMTHFHAFIFGVIYLVLAHLFIATSVTPTVKMGLVILGFVGFFSDLLAPWLIRFVAAGFAPLALIAWLSEWISFGAYVGVPLWEMWSPGDDDDDVGLE